MAKGGENIKGDDVERRDEDQNGLPGIGDHQSAGTAHDNAGQSIPTEQTQFTVELNTLDSRNLLYHDYKLKSTVCSHDIANFCCPRYLIPQ